AGFEGVNDFCFALTQILLAGFADIQVNENLVQGRLVVGLNLGIAEAGAIQQGADLLDVWLVRELHVYQRPAAEIDAPRDVVPEQHGKQTRYAEDQRKGEEIPFLSKEIDVYVMKEHHRF